MIRSLFANAYVCSPRNSTEAGAKSNGKSKWRIMQGIVLVPKRSAGEEGRTIFMPSIF